MKKSIVVLILLLSGVVVWLASKPASAPQTVPELAHFGPAEVFSMTLTQEAVGVISLQRSDEKWMLTGSLSDEGQVAADAAAVRHLLDDLSSMEIVRVVTRSPENYERLQIGLEKKGSTKTGSGSTQVTLKGKDGIVLLDLFVGKQGSDLISTYVRVSDMSEVLAVNKVLVWQVRRSYQGWKAAVGSKKGDAARSQAK
ncbi:MAG: DUF4340 domain-containing protein [Mariprofundaceae bacterium]